MKKYLIEGRIVNDPSTADGYGNWEEENIEPIEADSPEEALAIYLDYLMENDYEIVVFDNEQTDNEFGNPYIAACDGNQCQFRAKPIEQDES